MEIRNAIVLEVTKEKNKYIFCIPAGSSFGEAYDVAMSCGAKIWEMADEARQKATEEAKDAKK